jgi:hypothetical protein
VFAEVARAGLGAALPAGPRARLESAAQEIAVQNAELLAVALRAGAALDAAGIRWVPLKGVALAAAAPEWFTARHIGDVDLLVHPDDRERASTALAAVMPPAHGERLEYDGSSRRTDPHAPGALHHLHEYRAGNGVVVELHHALPGVPFGDGTEAVLARGAPRTLLGRRVLVPSLEDLLGIACVHVMGWHRGDRAMLLRHLADVAELLARGAEPDLARTAYDREGRSHVAASLSLLAEARAYARDPAHPPTVASGAFEPGLAGRLRGWADRARERGTRVREGLRAHGARAILPARSFMVARYGPAAAGPLLPLFHLRRLGEALVRVFTGGR